MRPAVVLVLVCMNAGTQSQMICNLLSRRLHPMRRKRAVFLILLGYWLQQEHLSRVRLAKIQYQRELWIPPRQKVARPAVGHCFLLLIRRTSGVFKDIIKSLGPNLVKLVPVVLLLKDHPTIRKLNPLWRMKNPCHLSVALKDRPLPPLLPSTGNNGEQTSLKTLWT